ncbi:RodZ domain-containing protein [Thalassotalea sp. PLHSN55]|uniref:RodZ domain-containing protein n=1 Tax=Thalassotalea sp. PLHSN55 TaxID=3435888 RepID=UPI003F82A5B9
MSDKEQISEELSEDIEVIGPGQMLAEAREKLGFSQEYVADKLNFKYSLVADIEQERFDKSLPATYNRGYLKNYAKLVHISADEVLSSYEMLGVAEAQSAEMQSFSKITEKQAQNNLLMWASYLIIAILIGLTAMWFLQDNQKVSFNDYLPSSNQNKETASNNEAIEDKAPANSESTQSVAPEANQALEQASELESAPAGIAEQTSELVEQHVGSENTAESVSAEINSTAPELIQIAETAMVATEEAPLLADVVFNFSGDCWVNIYDANGERVAWGVKKAGYEMKISALAPLVVTLGKPELVAISYNSSAVDMSQFNTGNIAKFSLPIVAN